MPVQDVWSHACRRWTGSPNVNRLLIRRRQSVSYRTRPCENAASIPKTERCEGCQWNHRASAFFSVSIFSFSRSALASAASGVADPSKVLQSARSAPVRQVPLNLVNSALISMLRVTTRPNRLWSTEGGSPTALRTPRENFPPNDSHRPRQYCCTLIGTFQQIPGAAQAFRCNQTLSDKPMVSTERLRSVRSFMATWSARSQTLSGSVIVMSTGRKVECETFRSYLVG